MNEHDDEPRKLTTVHWRFHVYGFCLGGWELAETFDRKADALNYARRMTGPRGYERCEVYDSMATSRTRAAGRDRIMVAALTPTPPERSAP